MIPPRRINDWARARALGPSRLGRWRRRRHAALDARPNDAARIASSVMSSPESSATTRPPRMTITRWASPSTSSISLEISRIATPLAARSDDQLVDVALRPDVDAAGRLVGDEHRGVGEQGPREHELLLVAARQGGRAWSRGRRRRRPCAAPPWPGSIPCPRRTNPNRPSDAQAGEADVLADGPAQHQAVVLARLGDHRDVGTQRPEWRAGEAGGAGRHLAGGGRRGAEDRPGELGSAGADEAREGHDLAGPDLERRARYARCGQVADGEGGRRSAAGGCFGG